MRANESPHLYITKVHARRCKTVDIYSKFLGCLSVCSIIRVDTPDNTFNREEDGVLLPELMDSQAGGGESNGLVPKYGGYGSSPDRWKSQTYPG